MAETDEASALARRRDLFDEPSMSDVKVIFGAECVYAQKAILSLHSPHFARLFKGTFKRGRKARTVLDLTGPDVSYEADAVYNMLLHIYGLEFEFEFGAPETPSEGMWTDLPMLRIAHEYEVPSLIKLMESRVIGRLDAAGSHINFVNQVAAIYKWSEGKHCQYVVKKCLEKLVKLMEMEEFARLIVQEPELAEGLLQQAMIADSQMTVHLVRKTLETKPLLAASLMEEALRQQSRLAADLLPEVLSLMGARATPSKRRR